MPKRQLTPAQLQRVRHAVGFLFMLPPVICLLLRRNGRSGSLKTAEQNMVVWANYIGDVSFEITGSLAAGMEGMDLLGCVVVGYITALGGGAFRDLMLGRQPIWWLAAWDEAALCAIVGCITFFVWPRLSTLLNLSTSDEWLFWTDTLGLAVFAGNGAYIAATLGTHGHDDLSDRHIHVVGCAMCGMFTATFGGLTRDVLIARPPRILYSAADLCARASCRSSCPFSCCRCFHPGFAPSGTRCPPSSAASRARASCAASAASTASR